jgi:hypothetical protein
MFRSLTTGLSAIAVTAVCTVGLVAPAQATHDPQGTCTKDMGVTTCTIVEDQGRNWLQRFTGNSCVEEVYGGGLQTGLEFEWIRTYNYRISTTRYRGHKQLGPTEYSDSQILEPTGNFGCQIS